AFGFLFVMMLVTTAVWKFGRRQQPPPKQVAPLAAASAASPADSASKELGFIGVVLAGEWVQVEPNVTGRIQTVFVKPGEEVTAGSVIAQLDVRPLKQELLAARTSASEAARRLARRQRLVSGAIAAITPEELDNARFD